MNVTIYGERNTYKRRLLPILLAASLSSGVLYYVNTPQVSLATATSATQPDSANVSVTPIVKKSFTPALPSRDPFAIPSEFQAKPVATNQGSSNNSNSNSKPKEIIPMLTGLIMSENSSSAIIQYGADSRSYRTGDFVGPNQITAISKNNVTLQGPSGTLVLSIGR